MWRDPFAELRKHVGGRHPQKAKLCVVLSAIEDVIRERRQTATAQQMRASPTEYFAALMTALEAAATSHQHEITLLLAMVLPYVPEAVMRAKFGAIAKCISQVLQDAAEADDGALMRSSATCLSLTLLAQEPTASVWNRPDVLRAFHLLLALATDARPKIRKVGQKGVVDVLQWHAQQDCDALSTHMASFAENVLASATGSSATTFKNEAKLVQLIGLLKLTLPFLQRKVVSSLVDALTKFLQCSVGNLRRVTLETFDALAQATAARLSQDTLQHMLQAVLTAEPSTVHDAELAVHAVSVLETALVRLSTLNEPMSRALLPRVVVLVCAHLESASNAVQQQSAQSLLLILSQCMPVEVLQKHQAEGTDLPTDLARVMSSLQSLLTLRFQSAWSHVLPLLAELFAFYGEASSPALDPLLVTCCELYESSEHMAQGAHSKETSALLKQVVSAAVSAMGPARFLTLVPLHHETEIIADQRVWLLAVLQDALKTYPSCELDFFATTLLELARRCEAASRGDHVTPLQAKKLHTLTMQIWKLFPVFAAHCVDLDTSFKKIAKLLANAMGDQRYPELRLTVCQGLQALVKRTRVITKPTDHDDYQEEEGYDEEDEDAVAEHMDEEKLARDRAALAKYAARYVPLLITFVEELDPEKDADRSHVLLDTLQGFASLAEPAFVATTFRKIMQTLLEASTDATKREAGEHTTNPRHRNMAPAKLRRLAHTQLALATALVAHMDMDSVQLLYRVIKPYLLDDADAALQKRSYAVLVSICDHHPEFMAAESNLKDMTESICESLLTCSIPAKKMRLRCLVHLIHAMELANTPLPSASSSAPMGDEDDEDEDRGNRDLIPNLVGEIMLCTKEANGKAREAAFELLVAMAQLMRKQHPETGMLEFVQMLLGGLAARTPHMRSAAVICLCRIVFEFGRFDVTIQRMMPQLLKTVLMLLHEKAREVIKSVTGFLKLGIAMLTKSELEPLLPDIINGLLVWIGESKNRFRAKTRLILGKLCRKYNYEQIAALVPDEDQALIKHIKKTRERAEKKRHQNAQDGGDEDMDMGEDATSSAPAGGRSFDKFMADSDDEDDHDDEEETEASENAAFAAALRRKKALVTKKKAVKARIHEGENEIVDFLDASAAVKNIRSANDDEDSDDGDGIDLVTSKDGRFIIPDDKMDGAEDSEDEDEDAIKNDVATQLERMGLSRSSEAGPGGKRKRGGEDADAGKEYRAKKAGGDIKKKGKLEPYAYIPLDPKLMAKRNKRNAVDRYKSNVGKRKNLR